MANEFVTYRSFNDKVLATELYEKLAAAGIPVAWESTEGQFDAAFSFNEFANFYYVKIHVQDFEKAGTLLLQAADETEEPPGDYYLFSFSDKELADVIKVPGEWNEYDRYWAQQILDKRGVPVEQEAWLQEKQERLAELEKPWELSKAWILGGIALLIAAFYFLHIIWAGGAVFLGLYISFSKKTLPNGERVKAFSPADRFLGRIVFITGLAIALLILLWVAGITDFEWFF